MFPAQSLTDDENFLIYGMIKYSAKTMWSHHWDQYELISMKVNGIVSVRVCPFFVKCTVEYVQIGAETNRLLV